VQNEYDFCFIDNAPALTIGTDNALVASDEVIVPLHIDTYSFWGLDQITDLLWHRMSVLVSIVIF
jgi:chromosome partitioning protein